MSDSVFKSKTIVLGVCGSIAAYKAVSLCRELVLSGARVIPVMTKGARQFVHERTFSVIAGERAKTDLFTDAMITPHIELAKQADLIVVAPATARIIGEYANGISRDLLSSLLLAARSPVIFCPAMHTEMWENEAVRENVGTLLKRGVLFIGPKSGLLSGGDIGQGRFADQDEIISGLETVLSSRIDCVADPEKNHRREETPPSSIAAHDLRYLTGSDSSPFQGKKVLVSAGGTKEPIDNVRYIGNRSSGKQGVALALAAAGRGAEVTLVIPKDAAAINTRAFQPEERETGSGDKVESVLFDPNSRQGEIKVIYAQTSAEMDDAVTGNFPGADILIMAAAVADFRPKTVLGNKHHKEEGPLRFELEETEDILKKCTTMRHSGQIVVGFAAESGSDDLLERGKKKLIAKDLDMIVLNDISRDDVGFEQGYNEVIIYHKSGRISKVARSSKLEVANQILDEIGFLLGQDGM